MISQHDVPEVFAPCPLGIDHQPGSRPVRHVPWPCGCQCVCPDCERVRVQVEKASRERLEEEAAREAKRQAVLDRIKDNPPQLQAQPLLTITLYTRITRTKDGSSKLRVYRKAPSTRGDESKWTVLAHTEHEAAFFIRKKRKQRAPGEPGIVHVVHQTAPVPQTRKKKS